MAKLTSPEGERAVLESIGDAGAPIEYVEMALSQFARYAATPLRNTRSQALALNDRFQDAGKLLGRLERTRDEWGDRGMAVARG